MYQNQMNLLVYVGIDATFQHSATYINNPQVTCHKEQKRELVPRIGNILVCFWWSRSKKADKVLPHFSTNYSQITLLLSPEFEFLANERVTMPSTNVLKTNHSKFNQQFETMAW